MGRSGTYPDLALQKGLELAPEMAAEYVVRTSTSNDVNEVNMMVSKDLYYLDGKDFVYNGTLDRAGGHSLVCCGYDEASQMLIIQNHWGTIWGLKGFFLCPYSVWKKQNNLFCWYERTSNVNSSKAKKSAPAPKKVESKTEDAKPVDETKKVEPKPEGKSATVDQSKAEQPKAEDKPK